MLFWYPSLFLKIFLLALFTNFEAKCGLSSSKNDNCLLKMYLRLKIGSHERASVLHFLKKSQSKHSMAHGLKVEPRGCSITKKLQFSPSSMVEMNLRNDDRFWKQISRGRSYGQSYVYLNLVRTNKDIRKYNLAMTLFFSDNFSRCTNIVCFI